MSQNIKLHDLVGKAASVEGVPKDWASHMILDLRTACAPFDDSFNEKALYDAATGYMIPSANWDGVLVELQKAGYKVKKVDAHRTEIYDNKHGPLYGLVADIQDGQVHVSIMEPHYQSVSASSLIPKWRKPLTSLLEMHSSEVGVNDMDGELGSAISTRDWENLKKMLGEAGYVVKRQAGGTWFIRDLKKPTFGIYADTLGSAGKVHLNWSDMPDMGERQFDAHASTAFYDFTATAAKAPSDKAVKKAAAVLKTADKAKVAAISEKLKGLIDQAVQIGSDEAAARKVTDAQMQKLQGQMDKIVQKQDAASTKADAKIAKMAPRIAKLQDQLLRAGGKNLIPTSLAAYFRSPAAEKASKSKKSTAVGDGQQDYVDDVLGTRKKKKALGKGLSDLVSKTKKAKGKTKKAVKKMVSQSSSAINATVEDSAVEVRDQLTEAFGEYAETRTKYKAGQASTVSSVEWTRKNAMSPPTKYGPAQKHFQMLTQLKPKKRDSAEVRDLISAIIKEAGTSDFKTPLSTSYTINIKSPDGMNTVSVDDGLNGFTVVHNFKA